jgi:hypothetical protein
VICLQLGLRTVDDLAELVEADLKDLHLRPVPHRRLVRAIEQSKQGRAERNGSLLAQLQADIAAVSSSAPATGSGQSQGTPFRDRPPLSQSPARVVPAGDQTWQPGLALSDSLPRGPATAKLRGAKQRLQARQSRRASYASSSLSEPYRPRSGGSATRSSSSNSRRQRRQHVHGQSRSHGKGSPRSSVAKTQKKKRVQRRYSSSSSESESESESAVGADASAAFDSSDDDDEAMLLAIGAASYGRRA